MMEKIAKRRKTIYGNETDSSRINNNHANDRNTLQQGQTQSNIEIVCTEYTLHFILQILQ